MPFSVLEHIYAFCWTICPLPGVSCWSPSGHWSHTWYDNPWVIRLRNCTLFITLTRLIDFIDLIDWSHWLDYIDCIDWLLGLIDSTVGSSSMPQYFRASQQLSRSFIQKSQRYAVHRINLSPGPTLQCISVFNNRLEFNNWLETMCTMENWTEVSCWQCVISVQCLTLRIQTGI